MSWDPRVRSALVPTSSSLSTREPRQDEAKVNQVFLSRIGGHQASPKVNRVMGPVISELTDEEVDDAIMLLQYEKSKRVQGKTQGIVEEFRKAITDKKWGELEGIKRKMEREFPDSMEAILAPLSSDFANAMKDACTSAHGDFDTDASYAIYGVIGKTPIFVRGVEKILEAFSGASMYRQDTYARALLILLNKDKSAENLIMVEARSKVFAQFLKQGYTIVNWIATGPVLFLSHEESVFDFPGYKEARNDYIAFFKKATGDQVWAILGYTPKRLPVDANDIFMKPPHMDEQVRSGISVHLKKCPQSSLRDALIDMFK